MKKAYKEGVTDDPRRVGSSWSGTRALADIENCTEAPAIADCAEIQVSGTDWPSWASKRYREGHLSATRCMEISHRFSSVHGTARKPWEKNVRKAK